MTGRKKGEERDKEGGKKRKRERDGRKRRRGMVSSKT